MEQTLGCKKLDYFFIIKNIMRRYLSSYGNVSGGKMTTSRYGDVSIGAAGAVIGFSFPVAIKNSWIAASMSLVSDAES